MASISMDDLDSRFRPIADELVRLCEEIEPMRVICTLRSPVEQANAVMAGVSRTQKSKHLAQLPEGKAWAIDIAPVRILAEKFWAPKDPTWVRMGAIGRGLGLRWGGDFKGGWDKPHFEWTPPPETGLA